MNHEIVIAGAGIGGLCAALALKQRGFDVAVYEQAPELKEVGAGLQLSPNAMHVLQALGIAEEVKAVSFCPQKAVMRHYKTGKEYFEVPLGDTASHKYSADYLHIHRHDLHHIILKACDKLKVSIHLGVEIQKYKQSDENVVIELNEDKQLTAKLLIGADGIKSNVQACMLGHSSADFTGQVAWRGVVPANKLPKGLIKPNANLWVGPNKHFVSYYVRGGELVNFVAVQERTDWLNESWNEAGNISELQQTFNDWHPEVTELLAATESCFLWALYDRKPLDKWVDGSVALLGDACHPMLPFLAQGAAMAIEDSFALAHCLATNNNYHEALQSYQAKRFSRTQDIQLGAAKNADLYHMSSFSSRAKLAVLSGLKYFGLSNALAANKLDSIYNYNIVKQLQQMDS